MAAEPPAAEPTEAEPPAAEPRAAWTVGVPLAEALAEGGGLELPAGVALLLVVEPIFSQAAAVTVRSVGGDPVRILGAPGGLLVPAEGVGRTLFVAAPPGARVRVHRSDAPGSDAAWDAWERAAERALRRGTALPSPPWGGSGLAASVALRAAAIDDPRVVRLGLVHDIERVRPVGGAAHLDAVEAPVDAGAAVTVEGPGVAVVRARPPVGPLTRFEVQVTVDGGAPRRTPVASTGAAPVAVRVWVPPGAHTIAVDAPGRPDVAFTVAHARLRPRLFAAPLGAPVGVASAAGIAEAERLWLYGDVPAARAAFAAWRDAPGPAGHLARARLLASETDPAEALRLATFGAGPAGGAAGADASDAAAAATSGAVDSAAVGPAGGGATGAADRAAAPVAAVDAAAAEVLADATLAAAPLLPDAVVLDAALHARDPDLEALAAWLDATGGVRPRGVALLAAAGPDVPIGPSPASRAVRLAGLDTRWTRLAPEDAAGAIETRVTPAGPGIPRVDVTPGAPATVTLPPVAAGRAPVLRLEAVEPTRLRLDGAAWTARPGALDVALPAGAHTIEVETGRVRVLDADLATGGARVYAWDAAPLPATWEIPDPGVAVDLAVSAAPTLSTAGDASGAPLTEAAAISSPREMGGVAGGRPPPQDPDPLATTGPTEWIAVFDDGATVTFAPPAEGGPVRLRAGPHARKVTLYGPEGARAGLAVRAVFPPPTGAAATPADDEAAALESLDRLSRAVDAGDPAARAARARLLGQLGQVGFARRDLRALLEGGDLVAGRALAAAVVPDVPSAPAPGPRSVGAALAAASFEGPAPTAPEALDQLGDTLDQPWLHVAAAEAWLEAGDPARALASARAAGPAGDDLADRLAARLRWTPVSYADESAGLVTTPRRAEDPAHATLWWRVREAMLAPPWPASEGVVVRSPGTDLVRAEGRSVTAELFCRDEAGGGRSCAVPLRVDGERRAVEIADGETLPLAWSAEVPGGEADAAGRAAHDIEVGPVPEGFAVAVRVAVDGALLPPGGTTTALRAAPGRPIVVTVATPAVLRASVVRGEARVGAGDVFAAGDAPALVPLPGPGPARVEIAGDADVLLAVGEPTEAGPEPEAPVVPPPPSRLAIEAVAPVLARVSSPGSPARVAPGDAGTWAFSLAALRTRLRAPVEPWDATEAEVAWMRARTGRWTLAQAWTRAPGWAGGGEGELGWTWPGAYAAVGVRAGVGTGVVDAAGAVAVSGRARRSFRVAPIHTLRVEGRGRAGWWSPDPIAPVDPRAWNVWGARHPVWLGVEAGWSAAPFRDLRLDAEIGATSNTGPSLDHVSATLSADLLVGDALVVGPTATLRWRFADAHRSTAGAWTDLRLRADWTRWQRGSTRIQLWGEAGLVQGAAIGQLGLTVLATDGRGLHDLPPGAESFRDARGSFAAGPFSEGEW